MHLKYFGCNLLLYYCHYFARKLDLMKDVWVGSRFDLMQLSLAVVLGFWVFLHLQHFSFALWVW